MRDAWWIPRILRPDYTWPQPMAATISTLTPLTPSVPLPITRRFSGIIHTFLKHFSKCYCSWFGVNFDPFVMDLPFGLVLKWTLRVNLEEVIAMQMARAAGMPVPKVLSCGEHPGYKWGTYSILMTRLPGISLVNSSDKLDLENDGPWLFDLKTCVDAMRQWTSPFGEERICSAIGTPIRTLRVPNHELGPFEREEEMHDYLLAPASSHGFESKEEYEKTLIRAKKIQQRRHPITFTHGDFKAHNILFDDEGRLSGFLDWESAGWQPDYWEFTTAMRFGRHSWWYQVVSWMGGDKYMEELDADVALNNLTVDSYIVP